MQITPNNMTKKYVKVTNETTKQCNVGIGTNDEFYKSIGMTLQEVEQDYDGNWYVLGFAPTAPIKPLEELQAEKIAELKANCQNYILSVYPIYKQLNIINPLNDYSNEDKLAMNEFIDEQRTICDSKEEEINNATLETINNIAINFGD